MSRKKKFPERHIINPLLTKFVRSRWLDIGLVLFCEFMDRDGVEVHKHQYPAIVTEQTWSITHMYYVVRLSYHSPPLEYISEEGGGGGGGGVVGGDVPLNVSEQHVHD